MYYLSSDIGYLDLTVANQMDTVNTYFYFSVKRMYGCNIGMYS